MNMRTRAWLVVLAALMTGPPSAAQAPYVVTTPAQSQSFPTLGELKTFTASLTERLRVDVAGACVPTTEPTQQPDETWSAPGTQPTQEIYTDGFTEFTQAGQVACTFVPEPVACTVSMWGPWERVSDTEEQHTRTVTQDSRYGGDECPTLVERRTVVPETDDGYFTALCARPDKFACYSLRSSKWDGYVYPTDPDPRRQDALKFTIPDGKSAGGGSVSLPIGQHHPQNLVVTVDVWFGAEFNHWYSDLDQYKLTPFIFWSSDDWFGMRTKVRQATQRTQTLPPGGPYVVIPYAHGQGQSSAYVKPPFYISNTTPTINGVRQSYPNIELPTTAPNGERREYGQAIAPVATDTIPGGMEFGVVAERWTRYVNIFERAPEEDWVSGDARIFGQKVEAYKWTLIATDEQRDPVKILDRVIIGKRASINAIGAPFRLGTFAGGASGNVNVSYAGRGPLVSYMRNVAVLHGTSYDEAVAMIRRPVASTPKPPSVFLSATPQSITPGQTITLRWASTQVERCEASGTWSGAKSVAGGLEMVSQTETSTYTITCTNAQGSSARSVTVPVN